MQVVPSSRALARCTRLLAAVLTVVATPATPAVVEDLYTAQVALPVGDSRLPAAFREALAEVLVKVSGQRDIARDPALRALLGEASGLVQQYQLVERDEVRVDFDGEALVRALDAADVPVWPAQRPVTAIWLAYDQGDGERRILEAGADAALPVAGPGDSPERAAAATRTPAEIRQTMVDAARRRGVPVVLPLLDGQDLGTVTVSDIWGDFSGPVLEASARYAAEAVLLGRARLFPMEPERVTWTLLLGEERLVWEGDLTAGPEGLADRLAERQAARRSAIQAVRVVVGDVASFADYGRISAYLRSLGGVESSAVEELSDDAVLFRLTVRGGVSRLTAAIASGGVLEPVAGGSAALGPRLAAELRYRVVAMP